MKQNKLITIFVVVLISVGVGAFYGGMVFGQSQKGGLAMGPNGQRFGGTGNQVARRGMANFINGDIIAKDDTSVTIKLRDGGSKIVFFSTSTEVSKFASGSVSDLIVGTGVMANGKTNTDGSLTASSIQIRPNVPDLGSGPGANPNSNPNPAPGPVGQ